MGKQEFFITHFVSFNGPLKIYIRGVGEGEEREPKARPSGAKHLPRALLKGSGWLY